MPKPRSQATASTLSFLTTVVLCSTLWMQSTFLYSQSARGTLVFGRSNDSVTLDPAGATDGESFHVTTHIYSNLVKLKADSTDIAPDLAESWTISEDGKTYTFKLNAKARFHDGTPVDAQAIVFNFMRQKDPKHPAYDYGKPYIYFQSLGLGKLIESVQAKDKQTVVFQLSQPNATFLACLSMQAFGIVSPTAVMAQKRQFKRKPVGSGPFVFAQWKDKQFIVLKANSDYFGEEKPQVATLIFRPIKDNTARMMEFISGKVHVMDNPAPSDIEMIQKRAGDKVRLVEKPGLNIAYLAMNNLKAPFDNLKVRQAINHAINKQALINTVYHGYAKPAVLPLPPTLWGYNNDIKGYAYDPERARALLKEAGFENGFTTTLWAMPVARPYMPNGRKAAEAIQGDLEKVGIKTKIVSYDWGTYLNKTQNGEHDMAILGWTGDIGDPDNFLHILLDKSNARPPAQNISFYKGEKVHQLLAKARLESNQAARAKLYKEAQQKIHEDAPLVPLAHSLDVVPVASKVENFRLNPTGRRQFDVASIKK